VLAAVGVVVGIAGYRDRDRIDEWWSLVRLVRSVRGYKLPSDAVVLRMLPSDTPDTWWRSIRQRCRFNDRMWREAENRLLPPPLGGQRPSVTAFLHELRSPSGRSRVVCMNLGLGPGDKSLMINVEIRLFEAGSRLRPARFRELVVRRGEGMIEGGDGPFPAGFAFLAAVPWGSDFKLLTAQPDFADRSRLILPYTLDGGSGAFVAELRDDDSIHIRDSAARPLPLRFAPRDLPSQPANVESRTR
jgi:hypothetical protein